MITETARPDAFTPAAAFPAGSRFLVQGDGRPDRIVEPSSLAALLAADDHVLLQLVPPGILPAPVPLTLCCSYPVPGSWTIVRPGVAGESEPVTLAVISASKPEEI
jgi:hypothetical protein